jgi:hypothetical protein
MTVQDGTRPSFESGRKYISRVDQLGVFLGKDGQRRAHFDSKADAATVEKQGAYPVSSWMYRLNLRKAANYFLATENDASVFIRFFVQQHDQYELVD